MTNDAVRSQTEFQGVELLLVTADPVLAECYQRDLPAASFHLWHAPTLEAAQPLLQQEEIAAILLDCAGRTLSRAPLTEPDLPLIALLQPNQEEQAEAILAAGFNDYLLRSEIDPRLLKRSVRYARERHAASRLNPQRDLLEQKWIAGATEESELRFRTFFETTPVGFVVGDFQGLPLTSNPAMHQMLGYSEAEMKELDPNLVTHPADIEEDAALFRELLAGKRSSYRLEKRYISKDGRIFWGDLSVTLVRDAQGQPAYFFAMIMDIDERKRAEVALQQSEELLRTIITRAPIILWAADKEGKFSLMEGTRLELLELEPGQYVGRSIFELFKDRPDIVEYNQRALAGENFTATVDFGSRTFENHFSPLLTPEGEMLGVVGVAIDITEYKQVEDALRESEKLYRTLIEQSNDAIYLLYDHKFELINQSFSEMFGVTAEEVRSPAFNFMELVAPESVGYVQERMRRAVSGEPLPTRYEFVTINRSGRRILVEASVSYISYQGGTAVQGILRDVTERKRTEDALLASEKRYRALIENSSDAVSLVTVDGTILYATPTTERILGYTANEFVGQNAFSFIHPEDVPLVTPIFTQLLEQPDNIVTAQYRMLHKDGSWIWLEGVGRNLLHDLSIGAIVANYRDVSERKQYEETLRRRADEFAALNDTFLAVIGLHDLPQVLLTIVERATHLLRSKGGALYLCNPQRQQVECVVSYNTTDDHVGTILDYGEGAAGIVAQTGRPLNIKNYQKWPHHVSYLKEAASFVAVLTVPLIWKDEVIGVIQVLDSSADRHFSEANLDLLTLFANQATLAVQNTQLLETEREQRELAEALRQAGTILSETLDFDTILDRLLDQIARVVPYDAANVSLVENGTMRVARMRGYERLGETIAEAVATMRLEIATTPNLRRMAATGRPLVIPDTRASKDWLSIDASSATGSWAGAPVRVQDQVIAFFSLDKIESNFYREEDAARLVAFAGQASLALQNARLFEEARRRARELNLLNRVIAASNSTQDEIELLQSGCTELALFFDVPQAAIALMDESQAYETVVAEYLAPGRPSALGARIPILGNPAMQELLSHSQPLAVLDVASHPTTSPIQEVMSERGSVSLLIVPIMVRGQVVGTLGIDSLVARDFTAEEIKLAKTVGEELGRALETARLYERLRNYAADLERRVAERTSELAQANERLKELDQLKSKFVSDVSHELRTPITNLSLYLDLLHRGKPEKRDSYLAVINEQTARLGRLIEDILNLSRLELGQEKIAFEATDINSLVSQVIAAHHLRAEAAGLRLLFTPDISLPPAKVAQNQLNLALSNLVANAINYTENGFVHVQTRYLPASGELYIQVADTGIGIDSEDQAHLFERFYRGHRISQSNIPGTGLGLAIVHEVVELHHGRIELSSQPGQGSTFHIWLPLERQTG